MLQQIDAGGAMNARQKEYNLAGVFFFETNVSFTYLREVQKGKLLFLRCVGFDPGSLFVRIELPQLTVCQQLVHGSTPGTTKGFFQLNDGLSNYCITTMETMLCS